MSDHQRSSAHASTQTHFNGNSVKTERANVLDEGGHHELERNGWILREQGGGKSRGWERVPFRHGLNLPVSFAERPYSVVQLGKDS